MKAHAHAPAPVKPSVWAVVADIDREIMEMKREEAKLIKEIKATAKTGNEAATRVLAKSLVRVRAQVTKLQASKAQLQGVSTQITVGCGGPA